MKKRIIATVLTLALVVSSVCAGANDADAAKKVKLSTKSKTLAVKKSFTLKLKNGSKKAKVTWKVSDKKVLKLSKQVKKGNKASVKVTAKKNGTADVKAVYKLGKKKKTYVCKVTVGKKTPDATDAPTAAPTDAPTVAPTAGPSEVPSAAPTDAATPTPKKTPNKTAKPTATPTPTPMPKLVNPTKVDLSTLTVEGENGGAAAYNAETGFVEADLEGMHGFILTSTGIENIKDYAYVTITYTINNITEEQDPEASSDNPDINVYLGTPDAGYGQDGTGWSGELKITTHPLETQVKVMYPLADFPCAETGLGKYKFFNFGGDGFIQVEDITLYMDGTKTDAKPFEASAVTAEQEITIDAVASAGEGWEDSVAYPFTSKVSSLGVMPTDTTASVRFKTDANNVYFFIKVYDTEIDATSQNNYERDGLELLFDEDRCGGNGSNSQDWTNNPDGLHYRFTGFGTENDKDLTDKMEGGGSVGKAKTGITLKYALTDNGYVIEGKVPFDNVKADGDQVNIDLIIQDCKDGVGQNELYLVPTDARKDYWNNTSAEFGTLNVRVAATAGDDTNGEEGGDDSAEGGEGTPENGEGTPEA